MTTSFPHAQTRRGDITPNYSGGDTPTPRRKQESGVLPPLLCVAVLSVQAFGLYGDWLFRLVPSRLVSGLIRLGNRLSLGYRFGFLGFFETVDDYRVASSLLDRARQWVKERGMTVLRGPGEYSNATHERQGLLIDGFQYPPTVELTHNPAQYREFLERYGFVKAKDYHAYILDVQTPVPERLVKLVDQVRLRRDIRTRPINLKSLVTEVRLIVEIYNEAWAQNWGFLPITDEEATALANSLRLVADPGMIRFAFVEGEPAGVLGALPDPYLALRPRWHWYGESDIVRVARLFWMRRHIPLVRLMFFGIRPHFRKLGIDALLFNEVKQYAMETGYQKCEASLLLEDNHLVLSASEFMGARRYKTWRIYDLPLE